MKRIYIDLDGVLNKYDGRNYNEYFIPEPAEGVNEFLEVLSKEYMLFIFTTRNKNLTIKWLRSHKLEKYIKEVTNIKDGATVYIDDRAICFNGNFNETIEKIKEFEPWYKKTTC